MKILVFSDSHGRMSRMLRVIEEEQPDAVIHLGDMAQDVEDLRAAYPNMPIYAVTGNNDLVAEDPYTRVIALGGIWMFLCHGHTLRVRSSLLALLNSALQEKCSVALYGHTHIEQICEEQGVWIMNPGSIALPAYGKPSYLRIKISDRGQMQSKIMYPDY